jgi:hypothetical protein
MRNCYVCKELKPRSDFYKDKTKSGSVSYICKKCRDTGDKKKVRNKYERIEASYGPLVKNSRGVITLTHKKCSSCKQWLVHSLFGQGTRNSSGISSKCLRCDRDTYLQNNYGVTLESYEKMLLSQGGGCAICGETKPTRKNSTVFCVDHDHVTGEIRGLLCGNCNSMLGHAKDNTANLRRGIQYLERHFQDLH